LKETNQKASDKHVKISADRHQHLKILSARTGKEMREIIEEAFDQYIQRMESREK